MRLPIWPAVFPCVLSLFTLSLFTHLFTQGLAQGQENKPTDWQSWLDKGRQDLSSARYAEAVSDFQKAADLNPEDPNTRLALAGAYLAQYYPGSTSPENASLAQHARVELERALQLDPRNLRAFRSLGALSLQEAESLPESDKLRKLDDARDWLQRVIEADPSAKDAYSSLGMIAWQKFSPAVVAARAQLQMRPEDPGPLTDAAVRQELAAKYGGVIDGGIGYLNEALRLDPEYWEALHYLSLLQVGRADLSDSPDQYRFNIAKANEWAAKATAAEKVRGPERIRVAGEVQARKLVSKVDPVYPPAAEKAQIQGTVKLRAIIGKDGHVLSTQLVSGPETLVTAAQEAVRKWSYQPTLHNGQPVEVVTYIDVSFSLH
jgi:TonB family protein